MLSMSDIIEIMIKVKADEAIEELFESFCSRYQNWVRSIDEK